MGRRLLRIVGWMMGLLVLLGLICPGDRGRIGGDVTDAVTREPLTEVTVFTDPSSDLDRTDRNGAFVLYVEVGRYTVHYRKQGYQDAEQEVEVRKDEELSANVAMQPLCSIFGRITHAETGQAIAGAAVSTVPVSASGTSDAGGDYEIAPIGAGSYTVHITKAGYEDASMEVDLAGPGDRPEVNVALTPIRGVYLEPKKVVEERGREFNIEVKVSNVENVMLGYLVVTFDTEYLTFSGATVGDFLSQHVSGDQHVIWIGPDTERANAEGRVELNFGTGGGSPSGVSGEGVLAFLKFRTKQRAGESNIRMDDRSELRDHNDRKIEELAFFGAQVTIE